MKPKLRYEIYRGKDGHYFFRAKARNNKIVAQSEGYNRKRSAEETVSLLINHSKNAEVLYLNVKSEPRLSKSQTSKISALWRWLHWLVSRCDRCRNFGAETYHQNTRFEKHEDNIVTLCPCCKQENDEYWAERQIETYYK